MAMEMQIKPEAKQSEDTPQRQTPHLTLSQLENDLDALYRFKVNKAYQQDAIRISSVLKKMVPLFFRHQQGEVFQTHEDIAGFYRAKKQIGALQFALAQFQESGCQVASVLNLLFVLFCPREKVKCTIPESILFCVALLSNPNSDEVLKDIIYFYSQYALSTIPQSAQVSACATP